MSNTRDWRARSHVVTLRSVAQKGWNAKGLLQPLWREIEGGREGLELLTGIRGTELSSYNSGKKPLGIANARRIADALGISVLELGAPEEEADHQGLSILRRLQALAAAVDDLQETNADLLTRLETLERAAEGRRRVRGAA